MCKKKLVEPQSLVDFLEALEDPRIDRTKKHDLVDIIIIAICATIAGAKNWVEIEDFGCAKLEWFSKFLRLNHKIPSHDTFRRVFILLDPDQFRKIFMDWVRVVTKDTDLKQICIDGKTLRSSFQRGKQHSAIHMVNAWSTGASLAMGQLKTDDKSNEITAVPKLLELLDLRGHLVTADAINCQVKTAQKILDKKGDYLLAAKNNQKYLRNRIKKEFETTFKSRRGIKHQAIIRDTYSTTEEGHGRIEKRICNVMTMKEGKELDVNPLRKWPSLNSIAQLISERTDKSTGIISQEVRYYITSLKTSAKEILEAARSHWNIENNLHWVLDIVFREDDCKSRTGYSPENFSVVRQFALNLVKMERSGKSINRKQKLAGWDESFLLTILLGGKI